MTHSPRIGAAIVVVASLLAAGSAVAQSRLTGLMFKRGDANGDGLISMAEMRAMREQGFARVDKNGDQLVTPDEAQAATDRMRRFGKQQGDGAARGQAITRFDANQDGVVSRDEFVNGPVAIFEFADTNGDQNLSQAEADAFFAELQSARAANAQ